MNRLLYGRARFVKTCEAVGRDNSGAAAIEFAMVAAPFLAMLFALLEVAMLFLGNLTMEHALNEASRLIRTGQAQQQGFDQDRFKEEVCSNVVALFDCSGGLKVLVKSYNSFADVEVANPLDGDNNLKDSFDFDMGSEESIVLVRIFYEWSALTIFPDLGYGFGLSNMANGNLLVSASTTFRNEPFGG